MLIWGGDTYLKGWLKFHFSVFQPQDSICLCFKHTKKTKQWNYNKFFNIPKLGIFWHCFHCCWRDLGLLERNRLMPDIKGLFLLPASIQESHCISIEGLFGPFRKFKTPYFIFSNTNRSNVAFNVVIWLSFLFIKFLQSTIYLCRIVFKRWMYNNIRKLKSGFLDTAVDAPASEADLWHDFRLSTTLGYNWLQLIKCQSST